MQALEEVNRPRRFKTLKHESDKSVQPQKKRVMIRTPDKSSESDGSEEEDLQGKCETSRQLSVRKRDSQMQFSGSGKSSVSSQLHKKRTLKKTYTHANVPSRFAKPLEDDESDSGDEQSQDPVETSSVSDSSGSQHHMKTTGKKQKKETDEQRLLRAQRQIMSLFYQLDKNIKSIDDLYQKKMEIHEREYFAAYRGHMSHIIKQIQDVKKQLSDKELKIRRDQRVADLRLQVDWFKNEALTLKNLLNSKQEKATEFDGQNQVLSDQMGNLESQLGKAQKKSKKLNENLATSKDHHNVLLNIIQEQQNEIDRIHKIKLKNEILAQCKVKSDQDDPFLIQSRVYKQKSQDLAQSGDITAPHDSINPQLYDLKMMKSLQEKDQVKFDLPAEVKNLLQERNQSLDVDKTERRNSMFGDNKVNLQTQNIDIFVDKLLKHQRQFTKEELIRMTEEFSQVTQNQIDRQSKIIKQYQKRLYRTHGETMQINNNNINYNVNIAADRSTGTLNTIKSSATLGPLNSGVAGPTNRDSTNIHYDPEGGVTFTRKVDHHQKWEKLNKANDVKHFYGIFKQCLSQLKVDRPKMKQEPLKRQVIEAARSVALAMEQREIQQRENDLQMLKKSRSGFFGASQNNLNSQQTNQSVIPELEQETKRKIVSYFLHNDQVFQYLSNEMFLTTEGLGVGGEDQKNKEVDLPVDFELVDYNYEDKLGTARVDKITNKNTMMYQEMVVAAQVDQEIQNIQRYQLNQNSEIANNLAGGIFSNAIQQMANNSSENLHSNQNLALALVSDPNQPQGIESQQIPRDEPEVQSKTEVINPVNAASTNNLFITDQDFVNDITQHQRKNQKMRPQSGYPAIGKGANRGILGLATQGGGASSGIIQNQLQKIVSEEAILKEGAMLSPINEANGVSGFLYQIQNNIVTDKNTETVQQSQNTNQLNKLGGGALTHMGFQGITPQNQKFLMTGSLQNIHQNPSLYRVPNDTSEFGVTAGTRGSSTQNVRGRVTAEATNCKSNNQFGSNTNLALRKKQMSQSNIGGYRGAGPSEFTNNTSKLYSARRPLNFQKNSVTGSSSQNFGARSQGKTGVGSMRGQQNQIQDYQKGVSNNQGVSQFGSGVSQAASGGLYDSNQQQLVPRNNVGIAVGDADMFKTQDNREPDQISSQALNINMQSQNMIPFGISAQNLLQIQQSIQQNPSMIHYNSSNQPIITAQDQQNNDQIQTIAIIGDIAGLQQLAGNQAQPHLQSEGQAQSLFKTQPLKLDTINAQVVSDGMDEDIDTAAYIEQYERNRDQQMSLGVNQDQIVVQQFNNTNVVDNKFRSTLGTRLSNRIVNQSTEMTNAIIMSKKEGGHSTEFLSRQDMTRSQESQPIQVQNQIQRANQTTFITHKKLPQPCGLGQRPQKNIQQRSSQNRNQTLQFNGSNTLPKLAPQINDGHLHLQQVPYSILHSPENLEPTGNVQQQNLRYGNANGQEMSGQMSIQQKSQRTRKKSGVSNQDKTTVGERQTNQSLTKEQIQHIQRQQYQKMSDSASGQQDGVKKSHESNFHHPLLRDPHPNPCHHMNTKIVGLGGGFIGFGNQSHRQSSSGKNKIEQFKMNSLSSLMKKSNHQYK